MDALCQDCLAVIKIERYSDSLTRKCECGGSICACDGCQKKVERLYDGVRDKNLLQIKSEIERWNPETGIR